MRFTLDAEGKVIDVNRRQKSLMESFRNVHRNGADLDPKTGYVKKLMTTSPPIVIWLSIAYALLGVLLLVILRLRADSLAREGRLDRADERLLRRRVSLRRAACSAGRRPIPCRRSSSSWERGSLSPIRSKATRRDLLWVEALDDDNYPTAVPRAYRLPYNANLAERNRVCCQGERQREAQGGRTADFGNGEGGNAEATAREATPSTITTTGGGDPAGGGPIDPQLDRQENQAVNFTPLVPPRAPAKEGQESRAVHVDAAARSPVSD